ncbi:hypothetical protein [Bacillus sp. REN10]|uniref:hypothetical protein n=1 Tax=Bacillus sp. REN10 TaxID=2782541 RepID=UPI001EED28D5|nr:hypothetical protein [Bacillus sp. REN10]
MREETAAEIAEPIPFRRDDHREIDRDDVEVEDGGGRGLGYAGLIASILALFMLPVLFGAIGIVLGFMARRRGSEGLGAWAIGIGVVALVVGLFVLPFF